MFFHFLWRFPLLYSCPSASWSFLDAHASKFIGTLANESCSINKATVERRVSKLYSFSKLLSVAFVEGLSEVFLEVPLDLLFELDASSKQAVLIRDCSSAWSLVQDSGRKNW